MREFCVRVDGSRRMRVLASVLQAASPAFWDRTKELVLPNECTNVKMSSTWKQQKEAFVSDHDGGSLIELIAVAAVVPERDAAHLVGSQVQPQRQTLVAGCVQRDQHRGCRRLLLHGRDACTHF